MVSLAGVCLNLRKCSGQDIGEVSVLDLVVCVQAKGIVLCVE